MWANGLLVTRQSGQRYFVYHPSGVQVGFFFTGADGDVRADEALILEVTRLIAVRVGLISGKTSRRYKPKGG